MCFGSRRRIGSGFGMCQGHWHNVKHGEQGDVGEYIAAGGQAGGAVKGTCMQDADAEPGRHHGSISTLRSAASATAGQIATHRQLGVDWVCLAV
jgi:hypothetical protein